MMVDISIYTENTSDGPNPWNVLVCVSTNFNKKHAASMNLSHHVTSQLELGSRSRIEVIQVEFFEFWSKTPMYPLFYCQRKL